VQNTWIFEERDCKAEMQAKKVQEIDLRGVTA